jgi:N utilization substance protein B
MGGDAAREPEVLLKKNITEFAPENGDDSFMKRLLDGALQKRKEVDLIIEKAAPEWPIEKIDPIDRNILRLGLYELLFSDRGEVPAKVAINEAIELAKTFGSESSSRFVNGVLGAVYKELGEPGKDETSKKEKKEYPIERLGGAVVYARDGEQVYLALVHDVFGHWTLSKGKIQDGEDEGKGTVRNIQEELGLDVEIKARLGENEYVASHPEKGKIRKRVVYFLTESPFTSIELEKKGGLDDAKWFKIHDVLDLNFYSDMLPIVTKGVQAIVEDDHGGKHKT